MHVLPIAVMAGLAWFLIRPTKKSSAELFERVHVKDANGENFFDVFAKGGAFGAHQRMRVLRYKVTANGAFIVDSPPDVPRAMYASALETFGIEG